MDDEQIKAWVCPKCGAALPKPVGEDSAITCASCGTMFRVPQDSAQAGGVQIGGSAIVHGDIVGRDKIVRVGPQQGKMTPNSGAEK
jgi:hypothetical protein